jgi:hypothetical protein
LYFLSDNIKERGVRMAKTTVMLNENIQIKLDKHIELKSKTVPVSIRFVINSALELYFKDDISNKELLKEIKKIK